MDLVMLTDSWWHGVEEVPGLWPALPTIHFVFRGRSTQNGHFWGFLMLKRLRRVIRWGLIATFCKWMQNKDTTVSRSRASFLSWRPLLPPLQAFSISPCAWQCACYQECIQVHQSLRRAPLLQSSPFSKCCSHHIAKT